MLSKTATVTPIGEALINEELKVGDHRLTIKFYGGHKHDLSSLIEDTHQIEVPADPTDPSRWTAKLYGGGIRNVPSHRYRTFANGFVGWVKTPVTLQTRDCWSAVLFAPSTNSGAIFALLHLSRESLHPEGSPHEYPRHGLIGSALREMSNFTAMEDVQAYILGGIGHGNYNNTWKEAVDHYGREYPNAIFPSGRINIALAAKQALMRSGVAKCNIVVDDSINTFRHPECGSLRGGKPGKNLTVAQLR
ncbi:MAG: hypothetical protein AAGA35_04235 [Patescibacteria group bacterium]